MMRTLRAVCRAQFGQPATRWMLEVGAFFLRTETELIIKSRRVVPERLLNAGFEFRFSKMEDAMREIESRIHS
jgi:NAD dependent epimerase/dehydratase family enzyme